MSVCVYPLESQQFDLLIVQLFGSWHRPNAMHVAKLDQETTWSRCRSLHWCVVCCASAVFLGPARVMNGRRRKGPVRVASDAVSAQCHAGGVVEGVTCQGNLPLLLPPLLSSSCLASPPLYNIEATTVRQSVCCHHVAQFPQKQQKRQQGGLYGTSSVSPTRGHLA